MFLGVNEMGKKAGAAFRVMAMAALLLGLLAGMVLAADIPLDKNGLPMWTVKQWTDFPIEMKLDSIEELDALLAAVPIASFHREQIGFQYGSPKDVQVIFKPRVTEAEAAALTKAGYAFERVRDLEREGREMAERTWAEQYAKGGDAFLFGEKGTYPTHAQIGNTFAQMALDHPTLCRDFIMGSSVQGREQWGLVISDNVQTSEAEPEVMLSGTMHGDEVTGMFLLFEFAQYLIDHYQEAGYEDVTYLVDNFEITFIPSYNPDGTALHQRYNANGVDLNRNFPSPVGPTNTAQENVNYMNYLVGSHYVIGANYHGGALVMNYPYDHTYTLAPDNDACIKHSLEYSTTNLPMYNSPSFPQGITNGADWYVIDGGLQDYHYWNYNTMAVTIEVSNTKWPAESQLDGFWDDNLESMMNWVKAAEYGVNGIVTGADTGLPLDATVTVTGISTPAVLDPDHGDYYKMLDTGTYDITFSADGYITQTIQDVSVTWGQTTNLDVALQPVAHGDVSGVVTDLSGTGLDAQVNIYTHPVGDYVTSVAASAGSGGAYTAHLVYGNYTLEAVSSGYVTRTEQVTIGASPQTVNFSLSGAVEMVLFASDFESGMAGWTGDWGLADPAEGHNSSNSANDTPGDHYPNYATKLMTMAASVDLSVAMSGEVSFWSKWDIEITWDAAFFEVSTNGGGDWTPVATQHTESASGWGGQTPSGAPCFDGEQANWVKSTVDLAPYLGNAEVLFRFRLSSDSSQYGAGFFVDDFVLEAVTEEDPVAPVPGAQVLVATLNAYPNPFNPQTSVKFVNPRSGGVNLAIYDVQGRLVRTLVSESLEAGEHSRIWDGRGDDGQQAASGVYFARMVAGADVAKAKLMLVK
jgi:hypothetical protein